MNPKTESKIERLKRKKFRKVQDELVREKSLRKFKWEKFFLITTLCYAFTVMALVCVVATLVLKVLKFLGV